MSEQAPGSSLIGLYVENPKFRPQIRYVLALKSAISDRDVTFSMLWPTKICDNPCKCWAKKSLVLTFSRPFLTRKIFAKLVLKSAKLDKDIAKILLLGLKSAKYRQEYCDFEVLKSATIVQT